MSEKIEQAFEQWFAGTTDDIDKRSARIGYLAGARDMRERAADLVRATNDNLDKWEPPLADWVLDTLETAIRALNVGEGMMSEMDFANWAKGEFGYDKWNAMDLDTRATYTRCWNASVQNAIALEAANRTLTEELERVKTQRDDAHLEIEILVEVGNERIIELADELVAMTKDRKQWHDMANTWLLGDMHAIQAAMDVDPLLYLEGDAGVEVVMRRVLERMQKAESELAQVRSKGDELKRFVKHKAGCGVFRTDNNKCTCELAAALADWSAGTKGRG